MIVQFRTLGTVQRYSRKAPTMSKFNTRALASPLAIAALLALPALAEAFPSGR